MRGEAEENKTSAKVVYRRGKKEASSLSTAVWVQVFLFYSRFNNCVGDIGWENMADE